MAIDTINKGAPRIRAYDNLAAATHRISPANHLQWNATIAAIDAARSACNSAKTDEVATAYSEAECAAEDALLAIPAETPEQMIQKLLTGLMTCEGDEGVRRGLDTRALHREARGWIDGKTAAVDNAGADADEDAEFKRRFHTDMITQQGNLKAALRTIHAVLWAAFEHDQTDRGSLILEGAIDLCAYAIAQDDLKNADRETSRPRS
ncbi:hypothetical protein [Sphingomonas sanxanigenens]|uniref:Uncharacterized protein n=1 Tax=Sphingomonas sanxanigenens DSM 19645 = NX02 TaxID=1123269 RepID=W0ANU9_9SPHN|nr:hypothetical protein [Sphingomonas sanxanigenens]AHE57410.1 hypothetical protein NX02_29210 [Sphingomonas sanxanigenens DSM 19645 = NX02]